MISCVTLTLSRRIHSSTRGQKDNMDSLLVSFHHKVSDMCQKQGCVSVIVSLRHHAEGHFFSPRGN